MFEEELDCQVRREDSNLGTSLFSRYDLRSQGCSYSPITDYLATASESGELAIYPHLQLTNFTIVDTILTNKNNTVISFQRNVENPINPGDRIYRASTGTPKKTARTPTKSPKSLKKPAKNRKNLEYEEAVKEEKLEEEESEEEAKFTSAEESDEMEVEGEKGEGKTKKKPTPKKRQTKGSKSKQPQEDDSKEKGKGKTKNKSPEKGKAEKDQRESEGECENEARAENESAASIIEPWIGLHCCEWSRNADSCNWIAYGGYGGLLRVRNLDLPFRRK